MEKRDSAVDPATLRPRSKGANTHEAATIVSLKRNTAWNLIGSATPMLLGLIIIPYLIRQIGVEGFGILTLIWALIGYFGLCDFGIGRALTHQVSTHLSEELIGQVPGLIKTGLQFMLVTGIVGGVVLAGTAQQLGYRWLNVSPALTQTTTNCLLIASVGIPLSTITSGLKGVLEGYEDFKTTSILRILLGASNFGLPALTAMVLGPSLEYMAVSLVVGRLIILVAHIVAVHGRVSVLAVSRIKSVGWEQMIAMLSFGAWMTASNLISPLMVIGDRFIISFVLGAGVVAYYTVPFDFILRLLIIPAALTVALFPRFTYLFKRDKGDVRRLYRKSHFTILAVMLGICVSIGIGSFWGLSVWVGEEFARKSWMIASVLAVGLLFNSLAQVPHAAVQATGDVRTTALIHLAEFILYFPLLYVSLRLYGLLGAAIVWVIRVTADYAALRTFARREMA